MKTSARLKHGSPGASLFSFTSLEPDYQPHFPHFPPQPFHILFSGRCPKYNFNQSSTQNNHSKQTFNSSVGYLTFYLYHSFKMSFLSYLPLLCARLRFSQTGLFYCSPNVLFCHLKSCSFILSSFSRSVLTVLQSPSQMSPPL